MKTKLRLVIDLEVDDKIYPINSEDISELEWFYSRVLGDELILHSNFVGDEVGTVKVISYEMPTKLTKEQKETVRKVNKMLNKYDKEQESNLRFGK